MDRIAARMTGQIIQLQPRRLCGIANLFHYGMNREHQQRRIRELETARVPPALIVRLTAPALIPWRSKP